MKEILTNPVYAGLIKVPAYKDLPEKYVKGLHPAIITEVEFWQVQQILSNLRPTKVQPKEDFPLRGILKCPCGKSMTAGWSKGKNNYFLYYRCLFHTNINIPGAMLHEKFDKLIQSLSFQPNHVNLIISEAKRLLKETPIQKQNNLSSKANLLREVNSKIESLEEKFLNHEIESSTYQTWFKKYSLEKAKLTGEVKDRGLGQAKEKSAKLSRLLNFIPNLKNLYAIYEPADLFQKHSLVRGVFKDNLSYADGMFRTPYLNPIFNHNILNIK